MFQDEGSSSVASLPRQSSLMSLSPVFDSPHPLLKDLKSEERGLFLIHLLLACANHVANGSLENANFVLEQICHLASPEGDTMQRIAAHFTEALAERILKSWPGLYKALSSTRISLVAEEILVQKLFFELFPFLKIAFVITNQAIMEAMAGEKMVHIIDLNASEPAQWCALLHDLSARPEGAPHLRITGVHQHKEVLEQMAHVLTEEAEKLDIPFQFNPIISNLESLDIEKLRVKTGEALAISSVLQLHSLLASDDEPLGKNSPPTPHNSNGIHLQRVQGMSHIALCELPEKDLSNGYGTSNDSTPSSPLSLSTHGKMISFLNALWGLSPKVMVVTEKDSNHNGSTLMERLLESLYFYAALFDCLESTLPKTSLQRLKVEKMFGEEIKNIIACERAERKQRHEKLQRWIQRFNCSGFGIVPLSCYGVLQARSLLRGYNCDGYKIKEENGCVVICWQDRALFSVSAWQCRR